MPGSTGSESSVTAEWIRSTLAGDATLTALTGGVVRVFEEVAPAGTVHPYVVFALLSSVDVAGATEATRVMSDELWLVRAVGDTPSFAPLTPIAGRLDALLHGRPDPASFAAGTIGGGTVLTCAREAEHRLAEQTDDRHYRHLGGRYRVHTQRL